MKTEHIKSEQGLTLLEIMVAIIIITLSLLVLMNMGMVALQGNDWADNATTATQLFQEKLEQLRASPSPTSGTDTAQGMLRRWQVSHVGMNLLRLDVMVAWEDINGRTQVDTMVAYLNP